MAVTPLLMASAAVTTVATIQSANAASAAANYENSILDRNAKVAEQNAEQSIKRGEYQVDRFKKEFDSSLASTEANYAISGIRLDEGTPIQVMKDAFVEAEVEKESIMYNAKIESGEFKESAINARLQRDANAFRARQNRTASFYRVGQTLLGTASQVSMINKYGVT
tara:strand:- start:271 stop:771 length:501 start_codon:yes stop_codon:yes gene_type:complete